MTTTVQKAVLCAVACLLCSLHSAAQCVASFSCAPDSLMPSVSHPDSNYVELPGGMSPELYRLVDKLDSVLIFGKGRVSILHIGGSHVQADMYTDVFRRNVDSLNNGLRPPRGYVFPYAVAKTNNPLNYKTTYGGHWQSARCALRQFSPSLGVGGIAVFTQDTAAWFHINLNRDSTFRWQTTGLKLLARSTGGSFVPILTTDSTEYLPTPTDYGYYYRLPHSVTEFRISLRRDTLVSALVDTFIVTGLLPQADADGIVYHTIGVNGASVPSYLGCSLFEKEMKQIAPDLVIMAIGINDANDRDFDPDIFVARYNTLIASIRRVAPECAFIFITNNDSRRRISRRQRVVNTNGVTARTAFFRLAEQWGGGIWDLFDIMGGLGSMSEWQKAGLARKDCVHFTRQGYEIIGQLFYNAFLNFYMEQDYAIDNN